MLASLLNRVITEEAPRERTEAVDFNRVFSCACCSIHFCLIAGSVYVSSHSEDES